MKRFIADIAGAFAGIAVPEGSADEAARRGFSRIETPLLLPATFADGLKTIRGRYRSVIEALLGRPVRRLLIAPVPGYILEALPDIVAEFPELVLADNFKAGTMIGDICCVSLDEALLDPRGLDACVLGTVDPPLGALFRERLPADRTIGAAELIWLDPAGRSRPIAPALAQFQSRIAAAPRALLVVTAYLDATFGPTLDALNQHGVEVFVVTRRPFSADDGVNTTDPGTIGDDRYYAAEFDEMLWLLRQSGTCPVMVNYARFFASQWDLRNTLPLFAYSISVLRAAAGPKILHLYDAYQVCLDGLDAEKASFTLYRELMAVADGIVVNADTVPVLQEFLGTEKPMISFFRYGPDADVQVEPDPGPFSIVMITSFLGEANDPTRMTADAVRALLVQGIHVHYYAAGPTARDFLAGLPDTLKPRFHLHTPIRDQRALVREISRYHAGWFVADMSCCEALADQFSTPFAKSLAACFVPTTIATAGMIYGCAGLPTFFIDGHYTARLFAPGTAIEIGLADVARLKDLIATRDWGAMRRDMVAGREKFSTAAHIGRLVNWLDQFLEPEQSTNSPIMASMSENPSASAD